MKYPQVFVAALVSLSLAGCITTQPLSLDRQQLTRELAPGDRVTVVTKNGETLRFTVEGVDEQGVRGEGRQVAYQDIESIGRNQVNVGRTALIVIGAAAVVAAAASGGGGGGSSY